ncbi:glucose N-acetyltransferase [Colletotrichum orchidophilum]|uniref:Glucose N-acetyltransferase n=1 Tax=Colletotrichum orchidophilum TaxID=1209926 RepID=A0A1G4B5G5_9PEZI|nr:glucose N-acetyltransferase [Colletotrichum orchidophilum]OHE96647.1 glucose N-acetyltransferase [Colletotrichum orchidophilum]
MALQWLHSRLAYTQLQTDQAISSALLSKRRPSLTLKQLKLATLTVFGLLLWVVVVCSRDQDVVTESRPSAPQHDRPPDAKSTDWSRFAYVQYVTDKHYLCNSVMFFERLQHFQSKADRVIMYPSDMLVSPLDTEGTSDEAKLLILAREKYDVKLAPISIQRRTGADPTWAESFTKLLAFNQTKYERVLSIDSDSTLLQHMDELFFLPPAPVAMPRAYWLYPEKQILSSQFMLIQPSEIEFSRIMSKIDDAAKDDYDMEIVNQLYKDNALILPHRPYDLLTAEFRMDHHQWYLGNDQEVWDPVAVYNEAKLVHFSDWPLPKPWLGFPENLVREKEPKCVLVDGVEDCSAKDIWHDIYKDFRERRTRVCDTTSPETPKNARSRRRPHRN